MTAVAGIIIEEFVFSIAHRADCGQLGHIQTVRQSSTVVIDSLDVTPILQILQLPSFQRQAGFP